MKYNDVLKSFIDEFSECLNESQDLVDRRNGILNNGSDKKREEIIAKLQEEINWALDTALELNKNNQISSTSTNQQPSLELNDESYANRVEENYLQNQNAAIDEAQNIANIENIAVDVKQFDLAREIEESGLDAAIEHYYNIINKLDNLPGMKASEFEQAGLEQARNELITNLRSTIQESDELKDNAHELSITINKILDLKEEKFDKLKSDYEQMVSQLEFAQKTYDYLINKRNANRATSTPLERKAINEELKKNMRIIKDCQGFIDQYAQIQSLLSGYERDLNVSYGKDMNGNDLIGKKSKAEREKAIEQELLSSEKFFNNFNHTIEEFRNIKNANNIIYQEQRFIIDVEDNKRFISFGDFKSNFLPVENIDSLLDPSFIEEGADFISMKTGINKNVILELPIVFINSLTKEEIVYDYYSYAAAYKKQEDSKVIDIVEPIPDEPEIIIQTPYEAAPDEPPVIDEPTVNPIPEEPTPIEEPTINPISEEPTPIEEPTITPVPEGPTPIEEPTITPVPEAPTPIEEPTVTPIPEGPTPIVPPISIEPDSIIYKVLSSRKSKVKNQKAAFAGGIAVGLLVLTGTPLGVTAGVVGIGLGVVANAVHSIYPIAAKKAQEDKLNKIARKIDAHLKYDMETRSVRFAKYDENGQEYIVTGEHVDKINQLYGSMLANRSLQDELDVVFKNAERGLKPYSGNGPILNEECDKVTVDDLEAAFQRYGGILSNKEEGLFRVDVDPEQLAVKYNEAINVIDERSEVVSPDVNVVVNSSGEQNKDTLNQQQPVMETNANQNIGNGNAIQNQVPTPDAFNLNSQANISREQPTENAMGYETQHIIGGQEDALVQQPVDIANANQNIGNDNSIQNQVPTPDAFNLNPQVNNVVEQPTQSVIVSDDMKQETPAVDIAPQHLGINNNVNNAFDSLSTNVSVQQPAVNVEPAIKEDPAIQMENTANVLNESQESIVNPEPSVVPTQETNTPFDVNQYLMGKGDITSSLAQMSTNDELNYDELLTNVDNGTLGASELTEGLGKGLTL